jgi:hypothetical protein
MPFAPPQPPSLAPEAQTAREAAPGAANDARLEDGREGGVGLEPHWLPTIDAATD